VEQSESDIQGIAVHLAARIMGEAGAGEVVVSRTVKDLVAGSDIEFDETREHFLKGIEEKWQLFRVRPAN
jgi:class 3 adenylate cyclase